MKRAALAALFLAAAPAAQAFEITGGELELSYSGFTGNILKKFDKTTIDGQIEVGFGPAFSMQADLALINFGFNDLDATSFSLHSIYHFSDATAAGMYFGQDRADGGSLSISGIEIGHQAGRVGLEGYLTYAKDSFDEGVVYGASAAFDLSDSAEIGLRYDKTDNDVFGLSRVSLTGGFDMANGFSLTGEVGSAEIANSGSEPFFGIGAKIRFGANRGTTFGDRSVLNLLPGL